MFNFAFTKLILPTTLHPKKSIYTNNEQLRLQSLRMAAASGTGGPTGCHRLGKRRSMARLQQNHRNPLSKHQSMQQRVLPHKIRHQRRSFPAARHSRAIAISFHHVLREFTRLSVHHHLCVSEAQQPDDERHRKKHHPIPQGPDMPSE